MGDFEHQKVVAEQKDIVQEERKVDPTQPLNDKPNARLTGNPK
jgi:hypothetical protein